MFKLIKLEIKNNSFLYSALVLFAIFDMFFINPGYINNSTEISFFIVVMVLPITLFQVFYNEKWKMYFLLFTNRKKQFISKLTIPIVIFLLYNAFSFEAIDIVVDSFRFYNMIFIFPNICFILILVFRLYYKQTYKAHYLYLFIVSLLSYIFLYIYIDYKDLLVLNLLLDGYALWYSYYIFKKIEA